MNLVENLIDEVRWRYKIGAIQTIDEETVTEVAESIYPNFDTDSKDFITETTLDKVVFETLMRI